MAEIVLSRQNFLEFSNLAHDVFQPLKGFMDEDEFRGVVEHMRLPNGSVFPLPVFLDIDDDQKATIIGRPTVDLIWNGKKIGILSPTSFYRVRDEDVVKPVFGTSDSRHPGVAMFRSRRPWMVGGPIKSYGSLPRLFSDELLPVETKSIFAANGWKTIVGFQTRNVPHRAHEYLQRVALEHVDGLFIQPLIGRKKEGDYTPDAITTAYKALIAQFFPLKRVLFGILSTSMRYAGPREAIFHAVIRRNFGCTHFIVGRDHAGVGDYYEKYAAHDLCRRFAGELGINLMLLHGPFYCTKCDGIATEQTCRHFHDEPDQVMEISGTLIRSLLTSGKIPDRRFLRPEILESIRAMPLFIEGTE